MSKEEEEKDFALLNSFNRGSIPAMELLLAAGASVHEKRADGATAFHIAAAKGHVDVMRV